MTQASSAPVTHCAGPAGKPIVGLIGGMGSGKSRVAEEFRQRGAHVISGDQLGHEGLRQPAIREQIVQRWGQGVVNQAGEIDRRRVAEIVFHDAQERRALEAILFPWIEKRFAEEIAAANRNDDCPLIVLDAAILLEAGWSQKCDHIVYVHAPRSIRLERLASERGWSSTEVAAREKAQLSLSEKVSRADGVIDNSGSTEEMSQQVQDVLRRWQRRTGRDESPRPNPVENG
jgi:dephospho-CoA kinase